MGIELSSNCTIKVEHISKEFRVYSDKSRTLKQRVLERSRNKYAVNHVLKDLSFTISKGEAVGLIGHNGSGKSTTLKLLNRIIFPEKGEIEINGKVSSLIELGAGFHPDMSGRENIYINASIFGLKRAEIDNRIDDIIRFSELEEFIDNPVRTYSSGMYMRLAFSVAINVDADILLIDEILAVGDANFQRKCFDRLQKIKHDGVTIVIVSHSMDQIKSVCNRVIWLDKGSIREDGDPQIVCNDYLMAMDERAAERRKKELELAGKEISEDPTIKFPPDKVSPRASMHAKRIGSMKIRFASISILGNGGEEKHKFEIGEDFLIRFSLISKQKTGAVNLIFKVFNRYGGHCATMQSKWISDEFTPLEKAVNGYFFWENLQLTPGIYYIECAIRDSEYELCDNLTHFMEFTVEPLFNDERDNLGVIYVNGTWKWGESLTLMKKGN